MIIDGKRISEGILSALKSRPKPEKFFGAVLAGDETTSLNFLKQKEKTARELGVDFRLYQLPYEMKTDELRREIGRLAGAKTCGGFIVQLPLPESVNKHYILNAIPKEKDVDFLSEAALGAFYTGRSSAVPPSVGVVEEILKLERRDLRDLKVVLVGAGFLIGKPVGFWLQNRVAELTVLDSNVGDFRDRLKNANIVISGAGQLNLFSARDLKEGAIVIDFGFNQKETRNEKEEIKKTIVGDFAPEGANERNIDYTKTPGGTGPILVAKLFENFYTLNA